MTGEGISLGTPAYMAPEQAVADPNLTGAADIYSLGVVGYEMLVGAPPFDGRSAAAVLAAHVRETPPPIASRRYDVPRPLVTLIMQCLEKDPARRPRSGALLVRELEGAGASGGQPAVTQRGTPAAPAPGASPRWRRCSLLAARWPGGGRRARARRGRRIACRRRRPAAGGSVAVAIRPTLADDEREAAGGPLARLELTTALSAVPGYRVASPAAPDAPRPAGRGLLMEGTVQRERATVRVNLRFVDAGRDSTMWAIARQGAARRPARAAGHAHPRGGRGPGRGTAIGVARFPDASCP